MMASTNFVFLLAPPFFSLSFPPLSQGEPAPIDDVMKSEFDVAYNRFASSGRRVLGFAYKRFTADADTVFSLEENNFPSTDLIFLGLSAIMDPPRDGVRDAISKCHTGGIKVFMVTGDHPLTAEAIGREVSCEDGGGAKAGVN